MKKETLGKTLLWRLSCSLLVAMPLMVAMNARACGSSGTTTVTNLPPPSGYQVFALNEKGELTGFFYSTVQPPHAFIYDSGAITDLGTLGGSISIGFAMNSAGQVAGQADSSTGTHAFLYSNTMLSDLGTLGGSYSSAAAINESAQVVGESFTNGDVGPIAFLYANGSMVSLGTLGSNYSTAYDINNSGTVVGQSGIPSSDLHGFVYSNGVLSDLGTLGGTYSSAFAINDAGVIVGESSLASGDTNAFIYMGGQMTGLGTFGGSYSSAIKVNTNSQVIGVANTSNDAETHGFLYDHGTMTDLGTLGGTNTSIWALNNLGQIVGQSTLPDGTGHAFLWRNGSMVDLNTLLPANSGWELISAQFINDAKRIVGYGNYAGSQQWFVMDLAAADSPPIAVAGPDQTIDCQAQVTLNGSASTDPDNDPLTFAWSLGGTVLGTNAILTTALPLGTNVVTLTVSDPCNASSQTNVVVTVIDTTPPTGFCPSDMTASSDSNCQAPVPDVVSQVVASDNCTARASLTITQDPLAGTMVGLGPHPISVKVTDSSGNSSSCSLLFTVLDQTPPAIMSVPAPLTVSSGANCQAPVPNVSSNVVAMDNCTPANQLSLSQNPAAGTMLGTGQYTIVVTVTDASGNSSTGNVQLTVADTTPPSILSLPAPVTVSAGANCQGTVPNILPNVVATDNCTPTNQLVLSQNPAAGTVLGTGQYTIVVTVTDASGNSTTGNVQLMVADTTPPSILSLPAPVTVSAGANCEGTVPNILPNVVATDNCTPTNQLVLSQNPAAGTPLGTGQYTIVVTVTDASGNSSTGNVQLMVADTTPPSILSLPAPVTVSAGANCEGTVPNILPNVVATDNCTPTNQLVLSQNPAAGTPLGTGQYTIVVTVTDASGNSSTGNVQLIVADTTPPTILSLPAPVTVSAGANCQGTVPNILPNVVATDNCTPTNQLVLSQNPAPGTPLGTGQYTIVVTVTDASGNSSTGNVQLMVADTTPPTILSLPAPVTVSAGANCQGTVPNILPNVVATDNCTPTNQLVLSQNPAAGTLLGTGQYTIVVTVTDASGNSSSGNVGLTVADLTPPVFLNLPGPLTLSVDANCQAVVPNVLSNVMVTDNCTPASQLVLSQTPAAGTVLPAGQYLISVTATDLAGNTASATVALTIVGNVPPVIQSVSATPNLLNPPNHELVPVTVSVVVSGGCDSSPVTKIISITGSEALAPGDVQITGNLTCNLAASRNPSGNGRVYTITVQSTDAAGNSSTATVPVVVPKGNGNSTSVSISKNSVSKK